MFLHTYIPQDRLRTFKRNETLPDRTSGSALFADISGFTALTEGLRETLGSRRGGEKLSKHLGMVYSALITEVGNLGLVGLAQGNYAAARAKQEESLALRREMGDKWGIAISLGILGNVTLALGDHAAARVLYEESLALCKERDEKSLMAFALLGLGMVDLAEGKPNARENILASLHLRQEAGERLY